MKPKSPQKSPLRKVMKFIQKKKNPSQPPQPMPMNAIPVPKQPPQKMQTSSDFPFASDSPSMSNVLKELPRDLQEKISQMSILKAEYDKLRLEVIKELGEQQSVDGKIAAETLLFG